MSLNSTTKTSEFMRFHLGWTRASKNRSYVSTYLLVPWIFRTQKNPLGESVNVTVYMQRKMKSRVSYVQNKLKIHYSITLHCCFLVNMPHAKFLAGTSGTCSIYITLLWENKVVKPWTICKYSTALQPYDSRHGINQKREDWMLF